MQSCEPLICSMNERHATATGIAGPYARAFRMTLHALMMCICMLFAGCSDLGVHIDGFIATEATTVVVQSDADAAVTGRAADVVQAAATALEAALRLMRPGRKISEVAEPLQKVGLWGSMGASMLPSQRCTPSLKVPRRHAPVPEVQHKLL